MGVVGPARLPPAVRSRLEAALLEASRTKEFQDNMQSIQMPMRRADAKEFEAVIQREFARYGKAATEYGIKQP